MIREPYLHQLVRPGSPGVLPAGSPGKASPGEIFILGLQIVLQMSFPEQLNMEHARMHVRAHTHTP